MVFFSNDRARHYLFFFFFNDTATTEIYTLSLHDALPISLLRFRPHIILSDFTLPAFDGLSALDRKSTRLNSSHSQISYAVFCLKKKKKRFTLQSVDAEDRC